MTDSDRIDWAVAITKGTIGAVPIVGPIIAEVVGKLIPQQRIDRIAAFLQELDQRLQENQAEFRARLEDSQALDLLEEGLHEASRAVTDERKRQIASIVAEGLSLESLDYIESKHLLSLLHEINDIEVLILASYSFRFREQHGETDKWRQVTSSKPPVMTAPQADKDRYALQQSYRNHLARLGLLSPYFPRPGVQRRSPPRVGVQPEIPDFDYDTGTLKSRGLEITPLGELLLRKVGLVRDVTPKEDRK